MICVVWDGFPQYAARCVRALVNSLHGEQIVVVGRRPAVPDKGMEAICGCPVTWIEENESRGIAEICGEMPRFILISGWKLPIYDAWRDEVRNAGGKAACSGDNNFAIDGLSGFRWLLALFKMILGATRFQVLRRGKFDGIFVPGESGRRLFRFYGVEDSRIVAGLYSSDSSLFCDGAPLPKRKKDIVFVGQLCARKNVLKMIRSFAKANVKGDWNLKLYGCGPQEHEARALAERFGCGHIAVHPFLPPESLAQKYREARLLCLPSVEEHWGLVVHEAALSGCALLLSRTVGAAADLLGKRLGKDSFTNGFTFSPFSHWAIEKAMLSAMAMDDSALAAAQAESLRLAKLVSTDLFVKGFHSLMALEKR